ncbi:ribosomal RNA small subunit methyltransferase A [Candidatus Campbellbacteria bacterium RIFCSPLOWO2_02_FULL_35_11]|uniref:Ribosomal RNA small subunit methyltransferase A n=2 Tax=Candidatus Campbelliibacteriota TaxID=1752727 RepID=A0A1F5EQE3_9BACT|nr:MAG: ribosomal RNA small subunit methyltransferase A [Candidatus Campbellbacteria bacterium RIFCSPHIGHO2_12_FULL_35_10]OGD70576.1 MAG: ribosomal RNA small subunit methyltransferase A [Candidatus Campbellbacteria bacterium RIFCSPLOWO2_02_FULL_35_11]
MRINPKKSLGQNFLKSKNVLDVIIKTSEIKDSDIVLEIGPGKGSLTEKILEKAGKVIVVEKDNRLIYFLNEKFKEFVDNKKLEIIEGDILDFDIDKILKSKYKIIANIPYYITGQIIKKFLTAKNQPNMMVLMVQKEVAERIVDKPESLLSLSIKAYGTPKYIKTVKAKDFSPQPKVDSAILLIKAINKDFFVENNIKEIDFFELIKAGFSHKRKMLLGNLKKEWKNNNKNKDLIKVFEKNNISLKIRAEDLSLDDWLKILK